MGVWVELGILVVAITTYAVWFFKNRPPLTPTIITPTIAKTHNDSNIIEPLMVDRIDSLDDLDQVVMMPTNFRQKPRRLDIERDRHRDYLNDRRRGGNDIRRLLVAIDINSLTSFNDSKVEVVSPPSLNSSSFSRLTPASHLTLCYLNGCHTNLS